MEKQYFEFADATMKTAGELAKQAIDAGDHFLASKLLDGAGRLRDRVYSHGFKLSETSASPEKLA